MNRGPPGEFGPSLGGCPPQWAQLTTRRHALLRGVNRRSCVGREDTCIQSAVPTQAGPRFQIACAWAAFAGDATGTRSLGTPGAGVGAEAGAEGAAAGP